MKKPNLREIEKNTYMSYHQDGLIDIFVGFYILLFGAGILLHTVTEFSTWFIIPAIFPSIMVPIWISFKRRITIPRIGYVKFGLRSANKLMAVFLGLTVAGLGVFMVFGLGGSMGQSWAIAVMDLIISNSMIIIGISAVLISSLFAYTMGLKRLYVVWTSNSSDVFSWSFHGYSIRIFPINHRICYCNLWFCASKTIFTKISPL